MCSSDLKFGLLLRFGTASCLTSLTSGVQGTSVACPAGASVEGALGSTGATPLEDSGAAAFGVEFFEGRSRSSSDKIKSRSSTYFLRLL